MSYAIQLSRRVQEAGAGEALRMIEGERFSIYTHDGQLPNVSGLTPCERICAVG